MSLNSRLIHLLFNNYSLLTNQCFVLFAILTKSSITGTSVKTPTVVAKAAGESIPNNAIATATDNSKKLEAPIIPAGAAIPNGSFANFAAP